MKNCGQTVHDEVANKQTMEELKELLKVSGHMSGGHSQGRTVGQATARGTQWLGCTVRRGHLAPGVRDVPLLCQVARNCFLQAELRIVGCFWGPRCVGTQRAALQVWGTSPGELIQASGRLRAGTPRGGQAVLAVLQGGRQPALGSQPSLSCPVSVAHHLDPAGPPAAHLAVEDMCCL